VRALSSRQGAGRRCSGLGWRVTSRANARTAPLHDWAEVLPQAGDRRRDHSSHRARSRLRLISHLPARIASAAGPACRCGRCDVGDAPPHGFSAAGRAARFPEPRASPISSTTARCPPPQLAAGWPALPHQLFLVLRGWPAPAQVVYSGSPKQFAGGGFAAEPVSASTGDGHDLLLPEAGQLLVGHQGVRQRPGSQSGRQLPGAGAAPPGRPGPQSRCASTRKVWAIGSVPHAGNKGMDDCQAAAVRADGPMPSARGLGRSTSDAWRLLRHTT